MSTSPFLPVVTTEQAAVILGVTPARVRQLVAAKALRPLPVPGRAASFWRSEVLAYRDRHATTQVARSLPRPNAPLSLDTDTIIYWQGGHGSGPQPIHVRVYRGAHTVVILSEPAPGGFLINRIETIAAEVWQQCLPTEDMASLTWLDCWPPSHPRPQTADAKFSNIILERGEQGWGNPGWAPLVGDDLERLLGGAEVDGYDWSTYTTDLVEEFQRTGQPVATYLEPHHVPELVDTYRELRSAGASDVATSAILGGIALWQSSPVTPRPYNPQVHDPHAMATKLKITTTRPRQFNLPDAIQTAVASVADFVTDWDSAVAGYEAIHAEIRAVDEFADEPNPRLAALLQTALDSQRSMMTLADASRARAWQHLEPAEARDFFLTDGPWDTAYRRRFRKGTIDARERRMLNRYVVSRDPFVGRDFLGNAVLLSGSDDLAVLWPTSYSDPLPGGVRIVADSASGDRPVYLVRRNSLIGLLPHPNPEVGQWNFGYSGGGPARLEHDIAAFLGQYRPVTERTQDAIEMLVEHATDGLDIHVDDLP